MENNSSTNIGDELNINYNNQTLPNFSLTNSNITQQQHQLTDFMGDNIHKEDENDQQKNGKTRSRIPREILDILLQEFQRNNSPNSNDRKRIAVQCNIEEKRVRIWFQNKRAKLKKLQNSISYSGRNENAFYSSQNQGNNANDPNHQLFEDSFDMEPLFDNVPWGLNNNYFFIDSSSVSVGSWRRLKNGHLPNEDENDMDIDNYQVMNLVTTLSNLSPQSIDSIMGDATDLLLIISKKNNEINYFFSAIADEKRILFRVFFPIYSVVNCSISVSKERHSPKMDNDAKMESPKTVNQEEDEDEEDNEEELSQLSLMLNKPPKFAVYFTDGDDDDDNQWNICDDFSEDKQVSMSFVGSYQIPHIITGLEDSLKKMNSLILEYNSKLGGIYHVPQPAAVQNQQEEHEYFTTDNTILPRTLPSKSNIPLTESALKKNMAHSFVHSEFGFSPTPSNGAPFFQVPTTPSFLNGGNNMNSNHNLGSPYIENPLVNNSININNNNNDNNNSDLLHQQHGMESIQTQNIHTGDSSGLLNINDSLIDDDEMKNDLYINSMLDLS